MSEILKSGFSRNSFDRFGDDLCEEILHYLSFEEKIKLECVCKQWKSTIFKRQRVLQIVDTLNDKNKINALSINILTMKITQFCKPPDYQALVTLLKKCNVITKIIIEYKEYDYKWTNKFMKYKRRLITFDEFLNIIADNCHNLLSFDCKDIVVSNLSETTRVWLYFIAKHGNTLKSIEFPRNNFIAISKTLRKEIIFGCPIIRKISNIDLSDLIELFNTNDKNAQILFNIKTELKSNVLELTNNLMNIFVDRYMSSLNVFNIELNHCSIDCNQFAVCLSKLLNLKKLSIDFRRLLYLDPQTQPNINIVKFLKRISNCLKLEYLNISINDDNVIQTIDNNHLLSVDLLKNCNDLKYLKINSILIKDDFVKNIGKCLPKLKQICIETRFNITDKTLNSLSQLNQLSVVVINVPFNNELEFTDNGVANLFENCIALKSFTFKRCNRITTATIDKLIEIAEHRPKRNFFINFINAITFNSPLQDHIKHPLPLNLDIKFDQF